MTPPLTATILTLCVAAAALAADRGTEKSAGPDEHALAVIAYYDAIAARQYRRAYGMLSQCDIRLTSADGSVAEWHAPPGFDSWLGLHQDLGALALLKIHRHLDVRSAPDTTRRGDAETVLGIRTYCVTLEVGLQAGKPGAKGDRRRRCLSVAKGTDGTVRILGTRPGP